MSPPTVPDQPIRVGIVDDHAVVRDGTAALLERQPDISVAGLADSVEAARSLLEQDLDVIVLDIKLGDANAFGILRAAVRGARPAVVIQSAFDYPQFVDAALRLGAAGYVLKTDPFQVLVDAIRTVAAGGMAYSVRPPRNGRQLSPRELEVVGLVVDGDSNEEIAARLAISSKTVESHLSRIFARVGVVSRTELATRAVREGWLEDPGD